MNEIRPNEIRLNNIFLHAGRKVWVKITGISIDGRIVYDVIGTDEKATVSSIAALQPVELTEELVKKTGAECREFANRNNYLYDINGMDVWIYFDEDDEDGICMGACDICLCCHHLHHLQNMYYAITGEELRIEL